MKAIEQGLSEEQRRTETNLIRSHDISFIGHIHQIMPNDDSALQWSEIGSGVCSDTEATFNSLFERYVTRYDTLSTAKRRTDIESSKIT